MAKENGDSKGSRTDKYFAQASSWLSEKISRFVSFLFLLFGAGAIYGAIIVPRFSQYSIYLLGVPILLALIAYYNRGVAAVLFMGMILLFVL